MAPGDQVLLTKGISVEGTAIIAREFEDRLKGFGLTPSEVERCQNFLSDLSILPEAKIAAACKGTSAMHDVTEGGLATAVEELSVAGNHGIRVDMDAIPVFPETEQICRLLDMDPLGLIGSGSLLVSCREHACAALVADIRRAGIQVTRIGEVTEGRGIEAVRQGASVPWPRFEVDEITRMF